MDEASALEAELEEQLQEHREALDGIAAALELEASEELEEVKPCARACRKEISPVLASPVGQRERRQRKSLSPQTGSLPDLRNSHLYILELPVVDQPACSSTPQAVPTEHCISTCRTAAASTGGGPVRGRGCAALNKDRPRVTP
jgi:hypothetical protein